MISLERFSTIQDVLVPFYQGKAVFKGRRLSHGKITGWYRVTLGNTIEKIQKATPIDVVGNYRKNIQGYVYEGDTVIPTNFNQAWQHGLPESFTMIGNTMPAWNIATGTIAEDGNVYAIYQGEPKLHRMKDMQRLMRLEQAVTLGEGIDVIKEITPEMRYLYLLQSLKRDSYIAQQILNDQVLSEGEKALRIKEFSGNIEDKLRYLVTQAGGKFIQFHRKPNNRYTVEYEIGQETIKTTVNDKLQVMHLGFCASGEDTRHSLSSAVNLAKMYDDDKLIYITQR